MPDFDKNNNSAALDPENRGLAGLPIVPVWDPYGKKHMVRKDNANDLCRIGTVVQGTLVKWSESDPNAYRPPMGADGEPLAVATVPPSENQQLQALRDAAELMGIPIDARWGLKRLREEIGKLKAVAKSPSDLEAEKKASTDAGQGAEA